MPSPATNSERSLLIMTSYVRTIQFDTMPQVTVRYRTCIVALAMRVGIDVAMGCTFPLVRPSGRPCEATAAEVKIAWYHTRQPNIRGRRRADQTHEGDAALA